MLDLKNNYYLLLPYYCPLQCSVQYLLALCSSSALLLDILIWSPMMILLRINKLIELSKEIKRMDKEPAEMNLSDYEYSFYTAIADNK